MAVTAEQMELLGHCTPRTLIDLIDAIRQKVVESGVEPAMKGWIGAVLIGAGRDVMESLGCRCLLHVEHAAWPIPMAYQTPPAPANGQEEDGSS